MNGFKGKVIILLQFVSKYRISIGVYQVRLLYGTWDFIIYDVQKTNNGLDTIHHRTFGATVHPVHYRRHDRSSWVIDPLRSPALTSAAYHLQSKQIQFIAFPANCSSKHECRFKKEVHHPNSQPKFVTIPSFKIELIILLLLDQVATRLCDRSKLWNVNTRWRETLYSATVLDTRERPA